MNKYVFALAALLVAPAIIAECGSCKASDELAKKVIKRSVELEKSCSCSNCSGCSSCGKCCCKSPEGEKQEGEEASTKCNCGKPKPKAEEE